MKWGVRRAIGSKAREAARLKSYIRKTDKRISRMEKKGNTHQLSDKQKKKLKIDRAGVAIAKHTYGKTVKNLSEKDIRQGEREVMAAKIAKTTFNVAISALGIASAVAPVIPTTTTVVSGLNTSAVTVAKYVTTGKKVMEVARNTYPRLVYDTGMKLGAKF